jgi:hypothetical protein
MFYYIVHFLVRYKIILLSFYFFLAKFKYLKLIKNIYLNICPSIVSIELMYIVFIPFWLDKNTATC